MFQRTISASKRSKACFSWTRFGKRSNATKTVTAQSFLEMAKVPFAIADPGEGPAYLPGDIRNRLANAVIVYGTAREAGTNRYAAETLQARYRDRYQREVPIWKDFEATDALLAHKDVIFIGRPETNSALAVWREKIGLDYQAAVFKVDGKTYAEERNGLVFASKNPIDATHTLSQQTKKRHCRLALGPNSGAGCA